MATVRVDRVTVIGAVPRTRLRAVADEAVQATQQVRRIWGVRTLQQQVRIKVAATDAEFRGYGGGTEAGAQIAATTTADGDVLLAPSLFSKVTPAGRLVVLTHELTHVALHQAGLTGVAHWVLEGSAEFTAYAASGTDLTTLAPQLAIEVRDGPAPTGPPTDRQFADDPITAYQSAFVWCRFLAQRYGRSRFTSFVRAADAKAPQAFETAFGERPTDLRAAYGAFLSAQFAD